MGDNSVPLWYSLAFLYGDADELLNALPILLFCGAAAVVLAWLTQGHRTLRLTHLLVHLGQSQPVDRAREKEVKDSYFYSYK